MSRLIVPLCLLVIASFPTQAWAERADPPIWIVRNADSVVYMAGTVHMMRGEDNTGLALYSELVAKSDAVWLEIADISNPPPSMFALIAQYGLSPERPLTDVLEDADLEALAALLAEHGVPLESYLDARPWFAYLQVTGLVLGAAGFDPAQGLDIYIEELARSHAIPVHGFESFEGQFQVFADMDEATQVGLLREVLFEADRSIEELIVSLDAWTTGDLAPLEAILEEMRRSSPEFYDALLVERNREFADGIEAILQGEGRVMVAVGLAHFAGPDSIPAILEDRGYSVEYR
ncbi:TraB/GumN family protein [Pelagibacterium limicola]|uniref:TraB/GumN family protein n=1 Tax=Pelagibacterium limicola TaxID=2791022 RepID=UPI0018AFA429|nr:TraB/GumN family protein [Pelagibacterium limicola]